jgi:tetratricopeptide (TPR) repeat protein
MSPALARWGRGILYALVVIYPLLFLKPPFFIFNPHDTLRRVLLLLAASVLGGLILLAWAQRGRLIWRAHAIDMPLIAFTGAVLLSAIGAAYPRISLFGYLWAHEFTLLMWGMCLLLALAVKEFLREPGEIECLTTLMVVTGAVVAGIGLIDYLNANGVLHRLHLAYNFSLNDNFTPKYVPGSTNLPRLVSTLGNPMFTGTYLATLVPLGLGTALATRRGGRRALLLAASALMLLSLFFTFARAAQLGFIAAAIVMGVLLLVAVKAKDALPAWGLPAVGLLVLALVAVGLSSPVVRGRLTMLFDAKKEDTIRTRQVYMAGALNAFANRPITGWGPGGITLVFPQFRPSITVREQGLPINRGFATAEPHNLPLQIAAESGLLGLVFFVMLLIAAWRGGLRALRGDDGWAAWQSWGLLGMLCAYLVTNLATFDNSATMATGWLGIGLLGAVTAQERLARVRVGYVPPPLTPLTRTLLRIACLVLILGGAVHVTFEVISAHLTNAAIADFQVSQSSRQLVYEHPEKVYEMTQAAVEKMKTAMRFVPALTTRGISYGLPVQYETLAMIHMTQFNQGPDDASKIEAFEKMERAANSGLLIFERDPKLLRNLALLYINNGVVDGEKAAVMLKALLTYEPNSAEVRLLEARYLANAEAWDQAIDRVKTALKLDPTFPHAWAYLGEYQNEKMKLGKEKSDAIVREIVDAYARAEHFGLQLAPDDAIIYGTNLALLQKNDELLRVGRTLRGTPQFDELVDKIRIIYKVFNKAADGEAIIASLKQPA